MRFINQNLNVNSISLRAVNGAGSMVLRSFQSLVLRLERICTGLVRAAIQKQLWPLTVGDQCFGIQHQTMYWPGLDTGSMRIYGTPTTIGKPATLRHRPAGLGLS